MPDGVRIDKRPAPVFNSARRGKVMTGQSRHLGRRLGRTDPKQNQGIQNVVEVFTGTRHQADLHRNRRWTEGRFGPAGTGLGVSRNPRFQIGPR